MTEPMTREAERLIHKLYDGPSDDPHPLTRAEVETISRTHLATMTELEQVKGERDKWHDLAAANGRAALDAMISRAREEERERIMTWVREVRQSVLDCIDLHADDERYATIWLNNFTAAIAGKDAALRANATDASEGGR